jgi:hypothetical protein
VATDVGPTSFVAAGIGAERPWAALIPALLGAIGHRDRLRTSEEMRQDVMLSRPATTPWRPTAWLYANPYGFASQAFGRCCNLRAVQHAASDSSSDASTT